MAHLLSFLVTQVAETALATRKEKIIGVAFDAAQPHTLTLYGEGFFCHVDLEKGPRAPAPAAAATRANSLAAAGTDSAGSESGTDKDTKASGTASPTDAPKRKRRSHSHSNKSKQATDNFRLLTVYKPLLFLEFVGAGELVVVERPWLSISQNLPDPFFRHKYRRSLVTE